MSPIQRLDDGLPNHDPVAHAALLEVAMRIGRHVGGGVSHDLNSALQSLGDALYAIREDSAGCVGGEAMNGASGGLPAQHLERWLTLADGAYARVAAAARLVPNLIPAEPDDLRPIDLRRELNDLVALTAHNWRQRLDVSADVGPEVRRSTGCAWVVRIAILRMVMIGVEVHPSRRVAGRPLPRIRITGAESDGHLELRVVCDDPAVASAAFPWPVAPGCGADETLELCAGYLGGEVGTAPCPAGSFGIVFRFPVRVAASSVSAASS